MSDFTKLPLLVEAIPNSMNWRLKRDVVYNVGSVDSEEVVIAPEGFITDFASVPRFFWSIFPPYHPRYGKASVIHDYLCKIEGKSHDKNYTSVEVHKIFHEAMGVLGAKPWERLMMYLAVRCFGPRFK